MSSNPVSSPRFLVICLCAEWCGTCRDYRENFFAMAESFPDMQFKWADIEEHGDVLDEYDCEIENFPTLHITRGEDVLFFGPMLPHHAHLRRMLEIFHAQTPEQSHEYACNSPERRAWQKLSTLPARLFVLTPGA